MKQHFLLLLDYEYWANTEIFNLVLANENIIQNQEIIYLCLHILDAQNGWYARVADVEYNDYDFDNTKHLNDLNSIKNNYYKLWKDVIESCDEDDFKKIITYTYLEKTSSFQLKDIITHVVNHSTHTRAQIITLLKSEILDIKIPETDYTAYLRTI